MTVIPGDTYAERAAAGTLSGRSTAVVSLGGGQQQVFTGQTQPANMPINSIWVKTDASGNPTGELWVNN